jgi:hypothetical protein
MAKKCPVMVSDVPQNAEMRPDAVVQAQQEAGSELWGAAQPRGVPLDPVLTISRWTGSG